MQANRFTLLLAVGLAACAIDDTIKQISETTGEDAWPLCCPILQDGSVDGCACRLSEEQICDLDNEVPATCPDGEDPVYIADHWGCPGLSGGCGSGFEGEPPLAPPDEPETVPVDACWPGLCCSSCETLGDGTTWCTGCHVAQGSAECSSGGSFLSCDAGACASPNAAGVCHHGSNFNECCE